ncbi:hypothetical protein LVK03_13825 [Tenacibaculum maritimum]|uniref:hypothetical protein n=1 Tax=Tenacibaculum maritimum TaxID=107401 RepID=UPI0012E41DA0|nr:hypothetical protein [Tenacibaculum maritimum]MCD9586149.1 hypothetical protein [Tenacibaculum maritimum]CAA0218316.1 conserved hypothetical protein [Tenacibaculum maritimum]
MNDKTIFTLNAREHIFLEFTKDYFELNDEIMHSQINAMFDDLVTVLSLKNINYLELKNCLIPKNDRKEIGLIFDTSKTKSNWYGNEVYKEIIPILNKKSSHSVLCGDFIGKNELQGNLHYNFFNKIIQTKNIEYQHSSQFYIIYINNLSDKMFSDLTESLNNFEPFVGYFDLTNQSPIKSILSTMLVNDFIKLKDTIIMGHEDDRDDSENVNNSSYEFEESNYKIRSFKELYFGIFLSYKIERSVHNGFESDFNFSLNSISPLISEIANIEIEDNKFEYLRKVKTGKLKKANLISYSKNQLIDLIKSKIKSNYIYNMTDLKTHNIFKFDIIIELQNTLNEIVKLTIGFEYIPKQKKLRLITLF